jgi:hypothetical protein
MMNMKPIAQLAFISLIFGGVALGQAPVVSVMDRLYQQITALAPYMFSEKKYSDAANQKEIAERLSVLAKNAEFAQQHKSIFGNNPVATVNITLLGERLRAAEESFARGQKGYSRFMLKESVQTCIGCHTSGFNNKPFFIHERKEFLKSLDNDFSRAEYLMTTRQFPDSARELRRAIEGFPANKMNRVQLEQSLHLLLLYYTRIEQKPKEAAKYFEKMSKRKTLPVPIRDDLHSYANGFRKWSREKTPRKKVPVPVDVQLGVIEKSLSISPETLALREDSDHEIERWRRAGELANLLYKESMSEVQEGRALYILGLIYGSLPSRYNLELDDVYLRLCVDIAPQTDQAKRCYRALEQSIVLKSTGSSGTHLDEIDQAMLKQYAEKSGWKQEQHKP